MATENAKVPATPFSHINEAVNATAVKRGADKEDDPALVESIQSDDPIEFVSPDGLTKYVYEIHLVSIADGELVNAAMISYEQHISNTEERYNLSSIMRERRRNISVNLRPEMLAAIVQVYRRVEVSATWARVEKTDEEYAAAVDFFSTCSYVENIGKMDSALFNFFSAIGKPNYGSALQRKKQSVDLLSMLRNTK